MADRIIYYNGGRLRSYKDILRQIGEIYARRQEIDEDSMEDDNTPFEFIDYQKVYMRRWPALPHAEQENQHWITLTQVVVLEKLVDFHLGGDFFKIGYIEMGNIEIDEDGMEYMEPEEIEADRAEIEILRAETESMRADIQALRMLFSHEPRFPQFRHLPPEIRTIIWELATPSRIVDLRKRTTPPVTALVCRESRAVARRHGRLVPVFEKRFRRPLSPVESDVELSLSPDESDDEFFQVRRPKTPDGIDDELSRIEDVRDPESYRWRWFDPSRDSLYLGSTYDTCPGPCKVLSNSPRHFVLYVSRLITQLTQYVTVQCNTRYMKWSNLHLLSDPRIFPQLKAVDFGVCSFGPPKYRDFILQTRLFGDCAPLGTIVTMGIDDDHALKKRIGTDHRSFLFQGLMIDFASAKGVGWAMSSIGGTDSRTPAEERDWRSFRDELRDLWMASQDQSHPPGGSGGETVLKRTNDSRQDGLSAEWLSAEASKCPTFRRVRVIFHKGEVWEDGF
ncbi:hypothetical protein GGR53DRAFT_466464 [Hypoxylon sp. FL1150]|nr:hypothetical protein GGR53DRAFT_466464 [Hypoxylon sp. FL1150]